MENTSQKLYSLRVNAGLTTEQMALLTKATESSVKAYETGYSTPSIKYITRVAEIFGVSLAFIAGLEESPEIHEDPSVKEVYVVNRLGISGIPCIDDVLGTAYMSRKEMHGGEYYAFVARDDSMIRARIQKGDMLIVRIQNYADNNDIVVALTEKGEAIVRRYHRQGNIVTLTSETPRSGFDPIKIDTTETKLVISGVVEEIRMNLK